MVDKSPPVDKGNFFTCMDCENGTVVCHGEVLRPTGKRYPDGRLIRKFRSITVVRCKEERHKGIFYDGNKQRVKCVHK